jgi:hypothetical protein
MPSSQSFKNLPRGKFLNLKEPGYGDLEPEQTTKARREGGLLLIFSLYPECQLGGGKADIF